MNKSLFEYDESGSKCLDCVVPGFKNWVIRFTAGKTLHLSDDRYGKTAFSSDSMEEIQSFFARNIMPEFEAQLKSLLEFQEVLKDVADYRNFNVLLVQHQTKRRELMNHAVIFATEHCEWAWSLAARRPLQEEHEFEFELPPELHDLQVATHSFTVFPAKSLQGYYRDHGFMISLVETQRYHVKNTPFVQSQPHPDYAAILKKYLT